MCTLGLDKAILAVQMVSAPKCIWRFLRIIEAREGVLESCVWNGMQGGGLSVAEGELGL